MQARHEAEIQAPAHRSSPKQRRTQAWQRFGAKSQDAAGLSFVMSNVLHLPAAGWVPALDVTLYQFAAFVLCEAALMATLGTTPGKYLWGVYITDKSGQRMAFGHALRRSFFSALAGNGAMFPVADGICNAWCYRTYVRGADLYWDYGTRIAFPQISWRRRSLLYAVLAADVLNTVRTALSAPW